MNKFRILQICILGLSSSISYAIPITGTFDATKACPAYVSKNKQTNPGDIFITPTKTYQIEEINKAPNPDWFRINISNAPESSLRWVNESCGIAHLNGDPKSCKQEPGLADSYVLALSWQPAFCDTYGYQKGKYECEHLPADSSQAQNFSLHGLWPNQKACGTNYGFCSNVKKQSNFCNYAPLNLDQQTSTVLHQVMPGYNESSCLERHEWNKHGTCQLLNKNAYYNQAANFVNEVNQSELEKLIKNNIGKSITIEQFNKVFDQSFGQQTHQKVYINCKNDELVDVYINLPTLNTIDNQNLKALLPLAPNAKQSSCPQTFKISNFSHN